MSPIILPAAPKTPYPEFAMHCDYFTGMLTHCKNPPMRAPRLLIPSHTPSAPDHAHLSMMTSLHFCELHKSGVTPAQLLTPAVKRNLETIAKVKRPIDFKPNFDRAFIEWVLTTTPEYRAFMGKLGYHGIRALALP